jgi:hypothetical protein
MRDGSTANCSTGILACVFLPLKKGTDYSVPACTRILFSLRPF